MSDQDKTKEQLVVELVELRQRVAELEASEAEPKQADEALDDEPSRSAFNLNVLLLATFVVTLLGTIALLSQIGKRSLSYMLSNTIFLIFAALILAVCYYLSRKGHVRAGSIIFTVMMTIACGGAIIVGGTRGALPVILIIPVVSASVTLGTTISLALAASSVAALVIVGLLERNGIITVIYPAPEVMALLNMFDVGFGLFFVTLGIWLAGYSLRQSLERARKEITERKRAEKALGESEQKYRFITEKMTDAVWLMDMELQPTFISPSVTRTLGYTLEELQALSLNELLTIESFEFVMKTVATELAPERLAPRSYERSVTVELEFRRKDGSSLYIESTITLLRDSEGRPTGLMGVGRDITERKRAEKTLRESELRYRTTINAMGDAIHLVDPDLRLTLANLTCQQWAEDFASGTADVVGLTIFEAFPALPDEACDRLRAEYHQVFDTGETLITEESTTLEGREFVTETRKIPVFENGRVSQVVTVIRDITERKRAEEEVQKWVFKQEVLREAMLALTTTLDRDEVVDRILAQLQKVVPYDTASVQLLREGHLEIVGGRGFPNLEELLGVTFDPNQEDNPNREVVRTRAPFIVDDAPTVYKEFLRGPHAPAGIRSWLGVPMLVGERLIGMIALDKSDPEFYTQEHAQLAEAFAAQAAIAIENAQLFEQARQELAERKRTEEALKSAELEKQIILDSQIEHVVYQDKEHKILWLNQAACESVEMRREALIGRYCYTIWAQRSERCEDCPVALAMETGRQQEIDKETPDGRIWFIRGYPVRNVSGEIVGGIEITQEITERKRAEEEREQLLVQIQEQARRIQQIMDTVPEGVLLLSADGQVLLANPVAERDLSALTDARVGDTITHLGNRPLAELLTSPPKGLWHEVKADALHGQKERIFEIIARPMGNGPEPEDWVLVINDATHQREIEQRVQQQERLAAVGQLAAGIAHDFNNIMATIVLYAQTTARMEKLPSVVRERMGTINQQAGHAAKLIQQILDFSRRAALERRPLDLALLLKDHVKLLKRTLPESIEIKLAYGLDEYMVHADPTRMQQVVTNLAVNARDAMSGGGTLRIGLERIEVKPRESPLVPEMDPGEWVQVTVSDTGTGIPPDVLPHIFDPFFTTKAPGEGSGLGLAQVHGIVGQHGGRIDVESHVGKGTTFIIYLPALSTHPPELSGVSELESLTLPTGKGETILVVEDNAIVRKALVESLELLNYRTREATNGQEALTMLEQHSDDVDLLLSDVVMPGMGGIALLHALKERGLTVKVVMITGHLLERELDELRAQGMADWLHKPPELDDLAEAVARVLGTD